MEVKPIIQTEKPKYPLKIEFKEEELRKRIPKRWAGSPAVKIALGTLAVVSLSGCYATGGTPSVIPPTESSISATPNYVPEGTAAPAMLNVAPLFVHGEGRGSCGCVMVAPPVFLSEDEALVVINEVAREYGIEFSAEGGPELKNVPQPLTNIYSSEDQKLSDKTMTFKADFLDSEHRVIIEFVSVEDVKKWHQETGYEISVESYNTRNTADQLSDSLEHSGVFGYTAGVFYDPCEVVKTEELSGKEEWSQEEREAAQNEAAAKAREMSEEQLKAQAKDFFEWLKAQGVI